jgi:hypothetical protein
MQLADRITSKWRSAGLPGRIRALRRRAGLALFRLVDMLPPSSRRSVYGPRLKKRPGDATYRFCITGT